MKGKDFCVSREWNILMRINTKRQEHPTSLHIDTKTMDTLHAGVICLEQVDEKPWGTLGYALVSLGVVMEVKLAAGTERQTPYFLLQIPEKSWLHESWYIISDLSTLEIPPQKGIGWQASAGSSHFLVFTSNGAVSHVGGTHLKQVDTNK